MERHMSMKPDVLLLYLTVKFHSWWTEANYKNKLVLYWKDYYVVLFIVQVRMRVLLEVEGEIIQHLMLKIFWYYILEQQVYHSLELVDQEKICWAK